MHIRGTLGRAENTPEKWRGFTGREVANRRGERADGQVSGVTMPVRMAYRTSPATS